MSAVLFSLIFQAALAAADSSVEATVAKDEVLVVAEQELPRLWRYVRYPVPAFDRRQVREHGPACVTLGFVIERNGRPSTIRVLKASPPDVFNAAAIAALAKMRYEPGPENEARTPVYSTITYTAFRGFGNKPEREAARIASKCDMKIVPPAPESEDTKGL
jgi:TonB family protein